MLRVAENKLSPSEREEREVERLIDKKPPPSRKYTDRRGPKHDNRRRRIKTEDPDLGDNTAESDDDMSLRSRKASLLQIAIHIAEDPPVTQRIPESEPVTQRVPPKKSPPKKESPPKKSPPKKVSPPKKKAPKADKGMASPDVISKLVGEVNNFKEKLQKISPAVAEAFHEYARYHIIGTPEGKPVDQIKQLTKGVNKMNKNLAEKAKTIGGQLAKADQNGILKIVENSWPKEVNDFAGKAAVIEGINQAIEKAGIPGSFAAPFKRSNAGDPIKDKKLIQDIINSASSQNFKGLDEKAITRFVQLISIYQMLNKNPDSVTVSDIADVSPELTDTINAQAQELVELGMVMDAWHSVMNSFKSAKDEDAWKPGQSESKVLDSIGAVFGLKTGGEWYEAEKDEDKKTRLIEPSMFMDELRDLTESKYGDIPEELEDYLVKSKSKSNRAATSNKIVRIETMAGRLAAYHGVDDLRGNPTDPINTPWRSHDKRYFTEDSYKSILKVAKQYLQEDWLKYCWEGGAEDAPLRAALDLAIHTADNNLYQSKIDAETYEMLLNRLAKWGYDTFSETILPFKKSKRSAAAMSQDVQNVLRIASEVRKTDPKKAVEIIANLRSMVSSEAEPAESIQEHASGVEYSAGPPPPAGGDDVKKNLTSKLEDLKKLIKRKPSKDDFIKGVQEVYKSFAVGHTAAEMEGLEAIEDMGDDELLAIFDDWSTDITKAIDDIQKKVEDTDLAQGPEVDDLKEMLSGLLEDIVGESKQASARIGLSTLIKIAYTHPDTRPILLRTIIAAKKKKEKAKAKKEKDKGGPPFEGAKPPFEKNGPPDKADSKKKESDKGKKSKPKGKKKKAALTREDLNW